MPVRELFHLRVQQDFVNKIEMISLSEGEGEVLMLVDSDNDMTRHP